MALQALDMGQWRLLLVLVTLPSLAAERQERSTELLDISQSLRAGATGAASAFSSTEIGSFKGVIKK